MNAKPTRVFLFMGFLGSGKTTLINRLLSSLKGTRIGIIINDWGKIPVDGNLIARRLGTTECPVPIVELFGGQLFCSCMSGSFLSALEKLSHCDLEYIFVEASGLAKPSTLGEIVREAETRCAGGIAYAGAICVIDATRFLNLRAVALVVDEQVAFADKCVITKTEGVSEKSILEVREDIEARRPGAPIFKFSSGELDFPLSSLLDEPAQFLPIPPRDPRFATWGPGGRPSASELHAIKPLGLAQLKNFLESIAAETYRIKGFVRIAGSGRWTYVDCVEEKIALRDFLPQGLRAPKEGLTVIWRDRGLPQQELSRRWAEIQEAPSQVQR
jgi:G3E family GTPase